MKNDEPMFQALATTDAESRLYEFNARNQITLWGPDGDIFCYHSILSGIIVGFFISPTFSNYIQTVISSSDKSHSLAPRPDPRLCRQAMVWAGGQVLHSKVLSKCPPFIWRYHCKSFASLSDGKCSSRLWNSVSSLEANLTQMRSR